ncbi:response regulator [Deinococcus malanensis]|uniref:Response regulator n=1 Tax=Deinococcus malanensis TaxID=1706855 RepID=A0ABQ2END5_9DEIO|nr:response regulator [Deinococcus malanensis]GGK17588.1 response regulator [Deinococcus malanensis]
MVRQILLIDDNPQDRVLAEEAFEQVCADCHLLTQPSGPEALEYLKNTTVLPDVLLLDVNMPGMNGFEVLAALKSDPRLALIPVVMLSTSQSQEDVARSYTLHASSYLVKAPSFGGFLAQIEAFLSYWQVNRVVGTSS